MKNRLRRFVILLPLQFNDESEVPSECLTEADLEIAELFNAASHETQRVEVY